MDDVTTGLKIDSPEDLVKLVREYKKRKKYGGLGYWPDEGPLRFDLYERHMMVMSAGLDYRERLFLAGNRTGKTVTGAHEVWYHATGNYPHWWTGYRFDHPVQIWVAGDSSKTTRDILQHELLGNYNDMGTGVIPLKDIVTDTIRKMPGVQEAVEIVHIRHKSGGQSTVGFKSYEQGRKSFQGTAKHFIWLDEEPPADVYRECLLRTAISRENPEGGKILTTCTPLSGWTEFLMEFDEKADRPDYNAGFEITRPVDSEASSFIVQAGMAHVPHLSPVAIKEILAGFPPNERKARMEGIPSQGAGAIYPVPEEDYFIEPIRLQPHWRKAYALDVGWNRTAAIWGAYDPDTDTIYFYDEYYRGHAEPEVHAMAIQHRYPRNGAWPGVIDPAARQRNQVDGKRLMDLYRRLGLRLVTAENPVEAGIYEVWSRLSTGRIKVFNTMANFQREIKKYRRDDNGKIVKNDDHLMDCMRYWVVSALRLAKPDPVANQYSVRGARDYGV